MAAPGEFGEFGGRHVPEPLEEPLAKLAAAYEDAIVDEEFMAEFRSLLKHFGGRPTPVFHAEEDRHDTLLVNLCGRGDKDMRTAAEHFDLSG